MSDQPLPLAETDPADAPAPAESSSAEWKRWVFGPNLRMTLVRILILTLTTAVVFRIILLPIRVTGQSMMPNYQDGRVNFINTFSYLRNRPQRGDVVAVLTKQGEVLLKRIVGLPGERISFHQGQVYVNEKLLEEPYTRSRISTRYRGTQLSPTEYFVAGDNRPITAMVVVNSGEILGKAVF